MPTVTVEGNVTLQQAATALHDRLGSRYEVTTHGSGALQALKIKQSAAARSRRTHHVRRLLPGHSQSPSPMPSQPSRTQRHPAAGDNVQQAEAARLRRSPTALSAAIMRDSKTTGHVAEVDRRAD